MPWANNALIQSLRLQYNAALAAHSSSKRALIEARMGGTTPASELVATETAAKALLEDIRAKLLAQMTKAIAGDAHGQPPPPTV